MSVTDDVNLSSTSPVTSGEQPKHWDTTASRMVVYRAGLIDSKGTEHPRKPLFPHADRIKGDRPQDERARSWSRDWWAGVGFPLDIAQAIVSDEITDVDQSFIRKRGYGAHPTAAKDIAHMPWLDDMLVIDPDMKTYHDSPDGTPFIASGNSATMAGEYTRFGLDDLYREAEAWGMSREELDEHLDTWTESTKSGGQHIVLLQNPGIRIDHTLHHRHEYRVDVLVNNWRGCYPSPGYGVLKDKPVKVAHRRLVELLQYLNDTLDPIGGKRMAQADSEFRKVHRQTYRVTSRGKVDGILDQAQMDRWRHGVLNVVHISHQVGNWNDRIFWAACRYAEGGWPIETAERDILSAAQPWDDREARKATDTIRSAYRGVAR
ncbi:hypothetical protein PV728_32045 [Streptomyces europaeiscabiei]|uniref:hypothetical protein n=1 Tax=Streptomyces europaeiscabiei TaxID=146819 RepID=UPI0029B22E4F|nr:hypothetical protein [Streptomyces europaeiscabiei]MDX3634810.1 hypothetical protein [Streptomyces europaeiscabiei]MDX3652766.1 hypothetical protein [Streptomyces europaeiscabiei]